MASLGSTLRSLRQQKNWTLEQLSSQCGLSTSFLSQAEREVCSVSIVSLEKICEALEVSLPEVLSSCSEKEPPPAGERSPVVHRGEGLTVQIGSYPIVYRHLTGKLPGRKIEVLIHEIPAGHQSELDSHEGEEFGYVLEGQITLRTESGDYALSAGDSYHFFATQMHGYSTDADQTAVVLIVSSQKFIEWYEKALVDGVGGRNGQEPGGNGAAFNEI